MQLAKYLWPNRHRGEVVGHINGRRRLLILNLAALAHLEACYEDTDILILIRRFAAKGIGARDVINILRVGLNGSGDPLGQSKTPLVVRGGFTAALDIAAQLIESAFGIEPHTPTSDSEPNTDQPNHAAK